MESNGWGKWQAYAAIALIVLTLAGVIYSVGTSSGKFADIQKSVDSIDGTYVRKDVYSQQVDDIMRELQAIQIKQDQLQSVEEQILERHK